MQYSTPQFIDREQKLLGPLTVHQTVILGLTTVFFVISYFIFNFFLFSVLLVILGGTSISISFIKINDRPVYQFVTSFFGYFLKPRIYIWQGESQNPVAQPQTTQKTQQETEPQKRSPQITKKELEELTEFLNK